MLPEQLYTKLNNTKCIISSRQESRKAIKNKKLSETEEITNYTSILHIRIS